METRASTAVKKSGEAFEIAGWRVDPASLRISDGEKTVKLQPRVMAVLDYLASRPGVVVTRQELEESLWAGTIVGYDALSNVIIKLRKAFDDKAHTPGVIETIPKTGYRLIAEVIVLSGESIPASEESGQRDSVSKSRKPIVAIVAVVLVAVGAVTYWLNARVPQEEAVAVESMTFPLPDKPSIAVMPLTNMSDDASQEYFADGMTEDLITDLSKLSGLFVIARNSTFSYKGQQVKIRQVAQELGVRYVLEGSVRRDGDQMRINAQLIDATTGGHLWAERYDGSMADVFDLQDKVVDHIVAALKITLTDTEQAHLARIPTQNLEAYDHYLRAARGFYSWSADGRREALKHYQKAIALDPRFADAYAGIARAAFYIWRTTENSIMPGPVARNIAYGAASEVLKLDPGNAQAYAVLARFQVADGKHDEALESIEKSVSLHPNNAEVYTNLARVLVYSGRHAEALAAMDTAFRLEPRPSPAFHIDLGWVLFWNRQYERAIVSLEKGLADGAEYWTLLAMTYAKLERLEEAKAMIDKVRQGYPEVNLAYHRASSSFKRAEDLELRLDALRQAGIPEWPLGYEVPGGDPLDSGAIAALAFGRTWVGKDMTSGGPFVQEFGEDGKVGFRGRGALVTGSAWVSDGQLCVDIPYVGMPQNICGYLHRNPDGTVESQNEYILVDAFKVLIFSPEP